MIVRDSQLTDKINVDSLFDTIQRYPEKLTENKCATQFEFEDSRNLFKCKLLVDTGYKDQYTGQVHINEHVKFTVECSQYSKLTNKINSFTAASNSLSCHELTKEDVKNAVHKIIKQALE